jgi:hypothetical protein
MITTVLAAALLAAEPCIDDDRLASEPCIDNVRYCCSFELYQRCLTENERDRIRRECEWCYTRSMHALEDAEQEIMQLRDYSVRKVCKSAIEGAILRFAGSGCKEAAVIAALSVIARYVDENIDHIWDAYYLLCDSKTYAAQGDRLQERLCRDE